MDMGDLQSATPTLQGDMTPQLLHSYDRYIVALSGGKDSVACLLHLIEAGVDLNKVELWHQDVDGREGSKLKFDWPVTRGYCQTLALAFSLPIYFSWKIGGFEKEMLRDNSKTQPIKFETPQGLRQAGGKNGEASTRLKFPQVSADLAVRWCSSYLKIDVAAIAINNQKRFYSGRTLFISGERAEESPNRARYKSFEPHRTDNREGVKRPKHIDHWRPVHSWNEKAVWQIIERHRVNPHPAYYLGFGRLSCMNCIFSSPNQLASVGAIAPERLQYMADYEKAFGVTIHRTVPVFDRAASGKPYEMDPGMVHLAMNEIYHDDIILPPGREWKLPAGAFGESAGPT